MTDDNAHRRRLQRRVKMNSFFSLQSTHGSLYHDITYITIGRTHIQLWTHNPYLALLGKLWHIYCGFIRDKWQWDIYNSLYSLLTFLIAWHFAASWYPTMFSGVQILRNGNSEFLAIQAASAVLPLLGGPASRIDCLNEIDTNAQIKWLFKKRW